MAETASLSPREAPGSTAPAPDDRGELVVVTGMTGAGRSTAAKELEDLGFYVVDNLPPQLVPDVVRLVDESRGQTQPIAVVVAETFEQARAAAALIRVDYARAKGRFDLAEALDAAPLEGDDKNPPVDKVGDFAGALADFNAALAVAPNAARIQVNRAALLVDLGRHHEALAGLEAARDAEGKAILVGAVDVRPAGDPPNAWEIYDMIKGIPQERYAGRGYGATANLMVAADLFRAVGGFAIGLERWTARLVGAANIREVTLFPRDLNRLSP